MPKSPVQTIITGAQQGVPSARGRVARGLQRLSLLETLFIFHRSPSLTARGSPKRRISNAFIRFHIKINKIQCSRFLHSLSSREVKVLQRYIIQTPPRQNVVLSSYPSVTSAPCPFWARWVARPLRRMSTPGSSSGFYHIYDPGLGRLISFLPISQPYRLPSLFTRETSKTWTQGHNKTEFAQFNIITRE